MCLTKIGLVCLVGAQLTSGDIAYDNGLNDTAKSYDGVERYIGHLYEDEQTNFNFGGYLVFDSNTLIQFGYDHGIDTKKYDVSKKYTLGVRQLVTLKEAHPQERTGSGTFLTISGSASVGGNERHTPCYDDHDREYYCGNLTAWSDFDQPDHHNPHNLGVTITYRW